MSQKLSRRVILGAAAAAGAVPLAIHLLRPAPATGPVIRLGLIAPFTGNTGAYGPDMEKAARLTVEQINAAGGLLDGHTLELLVEDEESSPTASVAAARKLLDVHKVAGLIGLWGSPPGLAVKPIALQYNTALFVSCSANELTSGDTKGLIWRFQARATHWGTVIARSMLKQGIKTVSVLALQSPFVGSMVAPFEEHFRAHGGQILETVRYNPDQPSYRAEVEQVFSKQPEAVFVPALLTDFSSIVKEVYRGGFTSKLFTLSVAADAEGKFVSGVGAEAAEGIHHFQPSPPLGSPGYQKFVKRMGARDDALFLFAGNTHDQVALFALAVEKARSSAPLDYTRQILSLSNGPGEPVDDVVEALKRVRAGQPINFVGAGSDVDFSPTGDQLNRHFGHYVIRNGQNALVELVS
ncbi:ABC transporter substrate-binding protein [Stigmatella erecta]|uniref:Branched-chain amino acid transport system substrate-binding protein n=1 Tax=Stigmatella erecta TaxID=83460 RepID=A0A1I0L6Y8_9BACT|nr:ABC transporter substrate-binding protein [Stigmatella erecta]SEU35737.1 branched-chain amino acid transport system substrate-binding protein [Stigmatella erecta]